jgi:hypothetical protein
MGPCLAPPRAGRLCAVGRVAAAARCHKCGHPLVIQRQNLAGSACARAVAAAAGGYVAV